MSVQTLPYGLWPSPITPVSLSQGVRLSDVAWDSDGETLVWLEGRSDRGVLLCVGADDVAPRVLTDELSVRARVGYGGGDFTVAQGQVYFVSGGRLYRQALKEGHARAITPAFGEVAAPTVSPDGRWIIYVYSYEGLDGLAVVDSEGRRWSQKLAEGDDFYMQPAWHPSGRQVAWVSWNHPQMPWDGTMLNLGTLEEGAFPKLSQKAVIAGDRETSIFQPAFSPDGRYLAYISDASGWWNLYLYDLETGTHRPLVAAEAELAQAAWMQGMRTYAWSADGRAIYYMRSEQAFTRLWSVDVATGATAPVQALREYTALAQVVASSKGDIALLGTGTRVPQRLLTWQPSSDRVRVRARSEGETVPVEIISEPQPVSWHSAEGHTVYGLYYAPRNPGYASSGKPPLIVMAHGGPTGQYYARYAAATQFFTTRGYAVLEVNYRGSTGYGRTYRNLLREQWGIYDSDDVVTGAQYLVERGLVDGQKVVIMGGSAGGYNVLQALIRYPRTFKAGVCLYGVTNLFTLASDTHKFEQRYLDSMIGPLPEAAQRYRDRSPIFFAERIADPVAVFQGEEDTVVPKDQAETIVAALRRTGVPYEYHLYPGEGHGWRRSETIKAFYETLLRFLRQHVLFA